VGGVAELEDVEAVDELAGIAGARGRHLERPPEDVDG